MKELTQEYLKSILDYNPETGVFIWKKKTTFSASSIKIGSRAGSYSSDGYIRITILGKRYYAHRLAWLFIHGRFPQECLDHINGIRDDNKIYNLREISWHKNHFNQKCKNETHGVKGVRVIYGKLKTKYKPSIKKDGIPYYIGTFNTMKDAAIAYNNKAKELFGEFAYLNDIDKIKN